MTAAEDPRVEPLMDLIAELAGTDVTICTRVWEAWSYGTMTADDFTPISEDPDFLREIATAVLDHLDKQKES